MPLFFLDDKHRPGGPFLVHHRWCLFRRKKALSLGEFAWESCAIEAAKLHRRNVGKCPLCCPPKIAKIPRKPLTKFEQIERRSRHQFRPPYFW